MGKLAWCLLFAGIMVLPSREARVSGLSFLPLPLSVMVKDTPIIVIARLARPEPEIRDLETTLTTADGKPAHFSFKAAVWHFSVLEVLKAPDAAPRGDIEVVAATLSKYYLSAYQYRQSGNAMRLSFSSNKTDYVRDVSKLGKRDAVLFLRPPMDPKYYAGEPYFKVFGQAYPLAAVPGLDDPGRRDEILGMLR